MLKATGKQISKIKKNQDMQTTKISLTNLQGKLSREAMSKISGGTEPVGIIGDGGSGSCTSDSDCSGGKDINCNGTIIHSGPGRCYDSGNGKRCHYSVGC